MENMEMQNKTREQYLEKVAEAACDMNEEELEKLMLVMQGMQIARQMSA